MRAAGPDAVGGPGVGPGEASGGEGEQRGGVRFDDVGRGSAAVRAALLAERQLDGGVRGDA